MNAKRRISRVLGLLAFALISLQLSTAFAQIWKVTSAGTGHWSSVACSANGTNLLAGCGINGASGPIITSTNLGQTWITNNVPSLDWQAVASSADGNTLVAAAYGLTAPIYYSTNAGTAWSQANVPGDEWRCLACSANGQIIVAGGYGGALQISTNSGVTWASGPLGYWYGVACSTNGDLLAAAGQNNQTIVISTNSGATWNSATNAPTLAWDSIACSADGTKLIAAGGMSYGGNSIYLSTNSGFTWTLATNAPNVGWYWVASSADGTRLVATGGNATYSHWLFTSFDSGYTWISNGAPYVDWTSVASSVDGTVLVGTVNNGGIWTCLASAPVISTEPTNQVVLGGTNVALTVTALSTSPIMYQWQFGGTNIPGATNASLTIVHAQTNNDGVYDVLITNTFGSVTSSNANLIVLAYPPVFALQPTNETIFVGSNASFYASATGPQPIAYQWQLNSTNLLNATNVMLLMTNAQISNAGQYSLVASNSYGVSVSSNANLTVIDLAGALNTTGLVWTTSGNSSWFAQNQSTHDGVAAAQSGNVSSGQQSILQTSVVGPGTLSFFWSIQSFGTLTFAINGVLQHEIEMVTGWNQVTCYLGSGVQSLIWAYSGAPFAWEANAAWLDQVSYIAGGTAPFFTMGPRSQNVFTGSTVIFGSASAGTPPLIYQWGFNGTNLTGNTNGTLILTNVQSAVSGIYSVVVTNSFGIIGTNANLQVLPFVLDTNQTNLVMKMNGFQLQIDGILAKNALILYASTDLVNWLPMFTNTPATGAVEFLDVSATNLPARFYRAIEQ